MSDSDRAALERFEGGAGPGSACRGALFQARDTPLCRLERTLPFEAVLYFRQWAESHARVEEERAAASYVQSGKRSAVQAAGSVWRRLFGGREGSADVPDALEGATLSAAQREVLSSILRDSEEGAAPAATELRASVRVSVPEVCLLFSESEEELEEAARRRSSFGSPASPASAAAALHPAPGGRAARTSLPSPPLDSPRSPAGPPAPPLRLCATLQSVVATGAFEGEGFHQMIVGASPAPPRCTPRPAARAHLRMTDGRVSRRPPLVGPHGGQRAGRRPRPLLALPLAGAAAPPPPPRRERRPRDAARPDPVRARPPLLGAGGRLQPPLAPLLGRRLLEPRPRVGKGGGRAATARPPPAREHDARPDAARAPRSGAESAAGAGEAFRRGALERVGGDADPPSSPLEHTHCSPTRPGPLNAVELVVEMRAVALGQVQVERLTSPSR